MTGAGGETRPHVVVLAGPNGAGKSTAAASLLRSTLGVTEFVNADVIAQGLSAFNSDAAAMQAGRIMLTRLKQLASDRKSFAFETTLASRHFASWLSELRQSGYDFHLFFFWLRSPELAIERVARRVEGGGHHVPDETVRRRYRRGITNFFQLFEPLATGWRFYDNSEATGPQLIAARAAPRAAPMVVDQSLWDELVKTHS